MADYEKTTTPNMVLDTATGAVLNTDTGAYAAIRRAREDKRKQSDFVERFAALELEVANLKLIIQDLMRSDGDK